MSFEEENKNNESKSENRDLDGFDDVEIVEEEEEKNPKDTIKKLRERLKRAEQEKQEYLEGWQRMKADTVNARRQDEEWRKEFVKFSEEKLLVRLTPVLESFALATQNKEAWDSLPKDWRIGMEYIYKELVSALSEHGLSEIVPKNGELFDPREHMTVSSVTTKEESLDHKVSSIVQNGYKLNEKVLKPARVIVHEYKDS